MRLVPLREVEMEGAPVNLNDLAVVISQKEGGAVQANIAQIKEILRITLEELRKQGRSNPKGVADLIFGKERK